MTPDFSDRLSITVDADSEPCDLDEAVAEFLIQVTRSRSSASESDDRNSHEADER